MRITLWLVSSVLLLFSFGLLMVFNTTSAEILDRFLEAETHLPLLRQMAYALLGVALGVVAYCIGYQALLRLSPLLFTAATLLLAFVFLPVIGCTLNGSHRWISLFGLTFQPSEAFKIILPLTYIHWFLQRKTEVDLKAFLKMLSVLFIPIILILLEPDHGATAILLMTLVVLFFLSKIRFSYWAIPLCVLSCFAIVGASQMPYVRSRIEVYLHPELDLKGKGHQPHQAKIAAGSGKLWGRGLGESLQKLNYLPEARSDYIAAIYAEETGFFGMLVLIVSYAVFTFSGIAIAFRAKDPPGFFLAASLTFLVAIQAFLNLGIVSGLLPSKGTTLPFFSQGGSSLLMNIVILFLLLDIARQSKRLSHG